MRSIALVLVVLIVFSHNVLAKLQGQAKIDSQLKELQSPRMQQSDDTNKVKLLCNLSQGYSTINPDEGIKYGTQGLALAEKLQWEFGKAGANNALGINYAVKGENEKGLAHVFESLKISKSLKNHRVTATTLGNIGNMYYAMGDYNKALVYQLQSEDVVEANDLIDQKGRTLFNIANIYFALQDYNKSVVYSKRALEKTDKENKYAIGRCLSQIGGNYLMLLKYDSAELYYLQSLAILEPLGNKVTIQNLLSDIGNVYRSLKNYPLSLEYQYRSLKIAEELRSTVALMKNYSELGGTYLQIGMESMPILPDDSHIYKTKSANLAKGIEYLNQAMESAIALNNIPQMLDNYRNLGIAYKEIGDYKKALENKDAYTSLKDSIFSVDNKVAIANLETKREADLKEKQIFINSIQSRQKKNERMFFLAGSGLLLLLLGVVRRNFRIQKNANSILAEKTDNLEVANLKLAEQQKIAESLTINLQESIVQKDGYALQLAEVATMKSKFLANVSHELRTPVTLLSGMLELLIEKAKELQPPNAEKLQLAYDSSRKLKFMAEELLDLARLEVNGERVHLETKEITALTKRMIFAFETYIEKEHLTLVYDDESVVGKCFLIDEHKYEKVVNNLVYNAIKFNTRGGSIVVQLGLSADGQQFIFTIANTGKIIDVQDLPHVFDRFYQGTSSVPKGEGVGIGLSMVKEFTMLMDGTVSVTSNLKDGTVFTLHFPVVPTPDLKEVDVNDFQVAADLMISFPERKTVLLVEDNPEMRYYLREVLGDKVNLLETGNGKEAIQWLEIQQPDLIISDIMMPEMDGREFVGYLKNTESFKKIPVITLTALADVDSQLSMLRMGIDDYIVKPFNADELRVRVANILRNQEERKTFLNQVIEEGEEANVDQADADEFRLKISEYVLSRIKNGNMSVYDLAFDLALSERQLYRMAKSLTGCTPAQLIKEVRLQKAYELLVNGKVNKIEDLVRQVGFEHVSYFSKQFFERFGKRPSEYI